MEKYEKPKLVEITELTEAQGQCMSGYANLEDCSDGGAVITGCQPGGIPTINCGFGSRFLT